MKSVHELSALRRQPRQARSRLLVASIREACRRILWGDSSGRALTARSIAEVAGVTIGSFYQYYRNKEAVLMDVLLESAPGEAERIAAETRYLGELRWRSLDATLRGLVVVTCDRHARLLERYGEVYRRYHRQIDFDGLVLESASQGQAPGTMEGWLRALLRHHQPFRDRDSLAVCAFLVAGALSDMSARALDSRPDWLTDSRFRRELQCMLLAYVGAVGNANEMNCMGEKPDVI